MAPEKFEQIMFRQSEQRGQTFENDNMPMKTLKIIPNQPHVQPLYIRFFDQNRLTN
jgi:hypothetical protein